MSQANPPTDTDPESSDTEPTASESGEDDEDDVCGQCGHDSVSPAKRAKVLDRDWHRCRNCGRRDPAHGGVATLHVHHIERDPDDIDEDALPNLTTLCRPCHHSVHRRPEPDDPPVRVTAMDMTKLEWDDNEIIRFLAAEGPASTSEVQDALTKHYSLTTIRERLWNLAGLDNLIATREHQLVDRDVETRKWGLPEQIERSTRGYIPSDPQQFMQRIEDEQVRRALERGCDRQAVEAVLDVSHRSTFHKSKRARARQFPIDSYRRSGSGGQHPGGGTDSASRDGTTGQSLNIAGHQQLDTTGVTTDAATTDHGSDAAVESPVEWDDVDPELLRQVREAFIEQFDDNDDSDG